MNFNITAENIHIDLVKSRGESTGYMTINFNADPKDVLDQMDADDITDNFDHDSLLNAIGKEAAMEFWGLKD